MNITVNKGTDYGTDLSVMVYDECNHAGAEIELLTYDVYSYWGGESEELPTLVCKCGFEEVQEPDEPSFESEYEHDV